MRRSNSALLRVALLLLTLNTLTFPAWSSGTSTQRRRHSSSGFAAWMGTTSFYLPVYVPNSPDNWLGGTGNWSNGADWSAGEPGSGSDVFITTGNDHVNLDVSATINSLTLGGSTGTSQLTGSSGNNLTIAGALTINSTGTLSLDGDLVTVNGDATNAGSITASNGSVMAANFTNTGTIMALDISDSVSSSNSFTNSGAINVYNVSAGGTLMNQGVISAHVLNVGGNLINDASGTIEGFMPGNTVSVTGQFTNSGTVDLRFGSASFGSLNNHSGSLFRVGADVVQGNVSSDGIIQVVSPGQNQPPATFTIGGGLITGGLLNVAGSGGVGASTSVAGNVNNTLSGIIEVDTLGSLNSASITNSGLFRTGVQGTGGNTVRANMLSNLAGGTLLLGGVGDTGQFGSVNNAGGISIANGASLQIVSSHAPTTAIPGFLNTGTVIIAHGGTLFDALTYSQTAGQTTVDGTLQVSGHSNVLFSGGAVYGNNGDIQGNTVSNAAFNIGDGPMTIGLMAINGNYTQGPNGALYVDIASLTQFDQLNISGHASFAGTLYVDLLNGYVPQIGNMFDVVNYSNGSGTFSMVIGLPINNQEHFVLEYNSTNLTLDVVSGPDNQSQSGHGGAYYEPYISEITGGADRLDNFSSPGATAPEPGSLILLASGLLGIAGVRRKRIR